jgi:hypothetical protein
MAGPRQLTGNSDTSARGHRLAPLKDERDRTLGGWLPAQGSWSAGLEAVATLGDVERVGTLGSRKSREGREDGVEEETHIGSRVGCRMRLADIVRVVG